MKIQTNKLLIKHLSPNWLFLHLCAHNKIHNQCVLLKLMVRLRECGFKALFKSDPKFNPNFAFDMPTYTKTTDIHSFHPTVIHATYLYSESNLDTQFQLQF